MVLAIDLILTHGGGQQVLLDFIRVARKAGQEVTVMVGAGSWIERLLGDATCVAVRVPTRHRSSLPWRLLRLLRFCGVLLWHQQLFRRSTLIVVNDPEAFLPAMLVARLLRKSVSLYMHMAYRGLAANLIRFAGESPAVDALLCVSHFVKEHVEHLLPDKARNKVVLIENAFPEDALSQADRSSTGDVFRVGIVGRLVPEKGQDVVCTLAQRFPRTRFFLIGPFDNADARYVDKLRSCAGSNVLLVGYQYPVIGYLQTERIGIVLAPSRVPEAFALTSIEATLAGCAVVVRNIGGLAEVANNIGLLAVKQDAEFGNAIQAFQAMPPQELVIRVQAARERAAALYHPSRFEHDVRRTFGW